MTTFLILSAFFSISSGFCARTQTEKVRKCEVILSQMLQIAAQSPTTKRRVRDIISQDASQGITFEMLFKYSLNVTDLL